MNPHREDFSIKKRVNNIVLVLLFFTVWNTSQMSSVCRRMFQNCSAEDFYGLRNNTWFPKSLRGWQDQTEFSFFWGRGFFLFFQVNSKHAVKHTPVRWRAGLETLTAVWRGIYWCKVTNCLQMNCCLSPLLQWDCQTSHFCSSACPFTPWGLTVP